MGRRIEDCNAGVLGLECDLKLATLNGVCGGLVSPIPPKPPTPNPEPPIPNPELELAALQIGAGIALRSRSFSFKSLVLEFCILREYQTDATSAIKSRGMYPRQYNARASGMKQGASWAP